MIVPTRRLVLETLPPLTLPPASGFRPRQNDPLPRLRRIVCVAAALTLPVLGVAVAETVHRAAAPKAPQAAAPVIPSGGAAAPAALGVPKRALRTMRTAMQTPGYREDRS
ncbi:hypothetical protein [Methylobacterium fujisawaense]|jgi:hypothetical protein|uniref:hypothetical protein n=1 Tax=Methylobacterium fujisawaense TaxID=107400 RepID=UPI0036F52A67